MASRRRSARRLAATLHWLLASAAAAAPGDAWVTYRGADGPGLGRTIVLVSGDEEYRSEEALPQLGRILAARHGFTCVVLFAVDPATGAIDPEVRTNIPGLEALADADLLVIATRFRDLPDAQMRHVDDYLRRGGPVVGLRTATHAFALESSPTYRRWSWNHEGDGLDGGFGRQVLGETWIAHHGRHGEQSTRGILADGARDHPIARGLADGDVWGPTDVYRVRLPLPDGCGPIVLGQVLAGMTPDDPPVAGGPNDPMMPVAWTRAYRVPGGRPGRVFTTTMGAATDLVAEGTRRMLVNAVYWAVGLGDRIPPDGADVRLVGGFDPSPFAFGGHRRGVRPSDHAWPPDDAPVPGAPAGRLELAPGARVVVAGNTFAERLAQSGWLDALAHAAHPDHRLVIRHVPWSGDEVAVRPREMNVPGLEDHLADLAPDVVVLCFGMSESFAGPDGLPAFETALAELIATARGSGATPPPDVVLVSPIAHEDRGPPGEPATTVAARNRVLARYVDTARVVAGDHGAWFVDLFAPPGASPPVAAGPLTTNGIHPTEAGCAVYAAEIARQLGWLADADGGAGPAGAGAVDELRELACDAHWYFRLIYRPTNTEYVWGRRAEPFGVVNFPAEMAQLARMVEARDRAIWAMPKPAPATVAAARPTGPTIWERLPSRRVFPEDAWEPAPVEAKGSETSLGDLVINDPDAFAAAFTPADGYVVECFASEKTIEGLRNPLAMTFDDRGRLWVLCAPTYPHLLPGDRPRCRLLILEDADGDGRADRHTVFADGLYVPTGFAVDTDAVYIGQAPDLLRLRDLDGDDVADRREIVLSGFGMPDSHHQVSAFEWDPLGGFVMHEGVFTVSNVETPRGTRRTRDAAVWRYEPGTGRLVVMSHCGFANPWGHVFDDFGQSVLADASGGDNFSFSHVIHAFRYPRKPRRPERLLNRGRPTAGCELIASRHFPEDVQDTFVVNQSIGFHGTRWDRIVADGSAWRAERMPQDLLECSDVNFRPVGAEIGPDGALYLVDWCNPLIGHMQYSVRDPRRDHAHGRIWRIRHRERALLTPPAVHDATIPELLGMLGLPERNTRQLARRRLQAAPAADVLPALDRWLDGLDPADPLHPRLVLESLWIRHAHGDRDEALLTRVLALGEPRARAGAARVLRHWLQDGDVTPAVAAPVLEQIVQDPDMRVRLEGVVACGFLPGAPGAAIASLAAERPMDDALAIVLDETLVHLSEDEAAESEALRRVRLRRMDAAALLAEPRDALVARVMVTRSDLPLARRLEAVPALGGDAGPAGARGLVDEAARARSGAALASLGEVLRALPRDDAAAVEADLVALAGGDAPARAAVATSVLLAHRLAETRTATVDVPTLVAALARLDAGAAPPAALDRVRHAVEGQAVEPAPAVAQVARHAPDRAALYAWLARFVDAVEGEGLHRWRPGHETAMAALQGMHRAEHPAWPAGYERYHVAPPPEATLEAGRALYHDETVGCVRCHGADGRGLEGFPPLDRSPWLLGDPRRAAAIVIHGLAGRLRLHDGRSFESAMAPLGASLDDEQVAAVLTWARRSWGNFAPAVTAGQAAAARRAAPTGGGTWDADALLAVYPLARDGVLFAVPPSPPAVAPGRLVVFLRAVGIYAGPVAVLVGVLLLAARRHGA